MDLVARVDKVKHFKDCIEKIVPKGYLIFTEVFMIDEFRIETISNARYEDCYLVHFTRNPPNGMEYRTFKTKEAAIRFFTRPYKVSKLGRILYK